MKKECRYVIADFNGEVCWKKLKDESYVVDLLYLDDFKKFKHIK